MAKFGSEDTQGKNSAGAKSDRRIFSLICLLASSIGWSVMSNPLAAQITPDRSLGTETSTEGNVTEITGGTRTQDNLFHSFQDFSLATDGTAFFNNSPDISNIISRVTGNNISNIDGLIQANGESNLILINPNGISFGNNARLDIGGSFLGSTAESVIFEDGTVLNSDLDTQPLLTISTPIGLQLGQNSAAIDLAGSGDANLGLEINAGKTFALVGNGITLDGGVVSAESGRIDLGSVGSGEVSINPIAAGWQLGYEEVTQFGSLELLDGSVLRNPNLANNSTGGIQLQGSDITLERSQVLVETLSDISGGNITVGAADSLILTGTAGMGENASQISNNVLDAENAMGGSITITTGKLEIDPRSFIDNSIFGSGSAGGIEITATEINLNGAGFLEFQQRYQIDTLEGNLVPGSRITGIFSGTATTGTAGDISIEADSLNLKDGAIILAPVFTAGNGGNINIIAADLNLSASSIQIGGGVDSISSASIGKINLQSDRLNLVDGAIVINATFGDAPGGDLEVVAQAIDLNNTPIESIVITGLYTNTALGQGKGGNLKVSANTINLQDAVIASNSGALLPDGTVISNGGLGGDIDIQAKDSITAAGIIFNPTNPQLSVGAGINTSTYSAGDGGNLSINTGTLTIKEGASFTSATFAEGDGGQLTIGAADSVEIIGFITERGMNRGGLFASSGSTNAFASETIGSSGNISIETPNLEIRDGAIIDVRSINEGDAGSIKLTGDSIMLVNRGNLSATTEDGRGGNIEIETKTLKLDRSLINASVLGTGTGGNIEINASDSVQIIGSGFEILETNLFDPNQLSPEFLAGLQIEQVQEGILAASVDSGSAGEIKIESNNLELEQGGLIATATAGSGTAGSILLEAAESLIVDASFLSNNTLFTGQGGDIQIDTHRLEILRGGQITVSTLGAGDSGNVLIDASQSVTVQGNAGSEQLVSNIAVGATPLPSTTGNGGDLTIVTPRLNIDGGAISIGSAGSGDAGGLQVNADSIMLDNQGIISADTESGGGGNITINANNVIWRGQSVTSATARGSGDGGNITINADNLVALESSRLAADAFMMGMGGNVQIETEGLFICGTCQITASSQLGLDGIVNIETLEPNTTLNYLDFQPQLTQPQEEVAVACPSEPTNSASQLTIIGRGGLPNRPQELLNGRSLIEFSDTGSTASRIKTPTQPAALPAPARGWYRNDRGQVMLTAQSIDNSASNSVINSVDCHE
ncbi:MAG: filamentous hemagglutinin N-terminal domain-containing protein [Cyanobacteria bacterium J06600_6]